MMTDTEKALLIHEHTSHRERSNLRDNDLVNLEQSFPALGAVLEEIQFLRDVTERLEDENDRLSKLAHK